MSSNMKDQYTEDSEFSVSMDEVEQKYNESKRKSSSKKKSSKKTSSKKRTSSKNKKSSKKTSSKKKTLSKNKKSSKKRSSSKNSSKNKSRRSKSKMSRTQELSTETPDDYDASDLLNNVGSEIEFRDTVDELVRNSDDNLKKSSDSSTSESSESPKYKKKSSNSPKYEMDKGKYKQDSDSDSDLSDLENTMVEREGMFNFLNEKKSKTQLDEALSKIPENYVGQAPQGLVQMYENGGIMNQMNQMENMEQMRHMDNMEEGQNPMAQLLGMPQGMSQGMSQGMPYMTQDMSHGMPQMTQDMNALGMGRPYMNLPQDMSNSLPQGMDTMGDMIPQQMDAGDRLAMAFANSMPNKNQSGMMNDMMDLSKFNPQSMPMMGGSNKKYRLKKNDNNKGQYFQ